MKNKLINLKIILIRCFVLRKIKNNSYIRYFVLMKRVLVPKKMPFLTTDRKTKKKKKDFRKLKTKRFF